MSPVEMYTTIYKKTTLVKAMKLYSHICEVVFFAAMCFVLYKAYLASVGLLISVAVLSLFSLIVVSVARRLIRAPRPCEVYAELEFLKDDHGSFSFPSRHAFSAFLISTLALHFVPILSGALLFLSLLLCAARVLLGRHFLRDVVAGAVIGVISGALVLLFSYNIFAV